MLRYIGKRSIYLVFVFFLISIMMFGLYKAVPGDPARIAVEQYRKSSPETYERLYLEAREELGLDRSIVSQYVAWMGKMLRGDFGYSTQARKNVIDIIKAPLQNTIVINLIAVILGLAITIPIGIWCAVKRGGHFDNITRVVTIVGYSLPEFITGLVFIFIFAVQLQWFPVSGYGTPGLTGSSMEIFLDRLKYTTLPIIVMTFTSAGGMIKYVRSAMIEALNADYVRTARAKGLSERVVIYSHAFRNALLPIVTLVVSWFISIFNGSVIIENMFALNGMGKLYITSLSTHDFQVVLALQMFYVIIALVGNLIVDLSYCLVDPRVKLG